MTFHTKALHELTNVDTVTASVNMGEEREYPVPHIWLVTPPS